MAKLKRPNASTSRQEAASRAASLTQFEGEITPRSAAPTAEPPTPEKPLTVVAEAPEPSVQEEPKDPVEESESQAADGEPTPITKPRRRRRRSSEPSGQTSHLQVRIPRDLHNRYKRLQSDAYLDGEKISQRSWLLALLEGGPTSAADLRDLIERALPEAKAAYSGADSVVGALVPVELSRRYRSFLNNLEIDENFSASMVQVIICLMHEGPETQSQLEELVSEGQRAA